MKKITCALLLGAMSSVAFADATTSATGFYVGLNVAGANTNVKYRSTNQATTSSPIYLNGQQAFNQSGGKFNPMFGLMAGYGMQFGQAYVGAELSGGFDAAKVNPFDGSTSSDQTSALQKVTVKRTAYYGFALRGGYFVTPSTMLYVKAGVEAGNWKMTSDFSAAAAALNVTSNIDKVKTAKKNSVGMVAGLGADIFLTKNLFLRAEYSYLFGPSLKIPTQNIAGFAGALIQGGNLASSSKVNQNRFNLGVAYKF